MKNLQKGVLFSGGLALGLLALASAGLADPADAKTAREVLA